MQFKILLFAFLVLCTLSLGQSEPIRPKRQLIVPRYGLVNANANIARTTNLNLINAQNQMNLARVRSQTQANLLQGQVQTQANLARIQAANQANLLHGQAQANLLRGQANLARAGIIGK